MDHNLLIDWFSNLVKSLGVWGIFLGCVIEEIIVPIPSSVVLLTGGAILLAEYNEVSQIFLLQLGLLTFMASLGGTLGALFPFLIFYHGGKRGIDKFGKYFGLNWDSIENFKLKLNKTKSDELSIFLLRTIPVIPSILLAGTCGVIRINPIKFSLLFFSGGLLRSGFLIFLGWQLGGYANIFDSIENISNYITKIAFTILIIYLVWILVKKKYNL